MASHFVRWTLVQSPARLQRLPQKLIEDSWSHNDKRRMRFLAARVLLAELMLRVYGMQQLPALISMSSGRPCFADPDLPDFSISYAGNQVGVLLAEEGGRAGLDMEIVRAHSRQTVENQRQCLTSGEKAWINAQHDAVEAATQIWTLRQCVLKLSGEGQRNIDSLRLHPASGRLRSAAFPDIQAICDVDPLLVWSCALSPGTERLRLWEYDEINGWLALRDIEVNKPNIGPRALRLTSMPQERLLQH